MRISFEVPGVPGAKARPRIAVRGKFARMYSPKETVVAENLIRAAAFEAMQGREPMAGACAMTIVAYYPWPKSTPKKRMAAVDGAWKTTKPDSDNITKLVKDALNGVVYVDDAQVATETTTKILDNRPVLRVIVRSLDGVPCEVPRWT